MIWIILNVFFSTLIWMQQFKLWWCYCRDYVYLKKPQRQHLTIFQNWALVYSKLGMQFTVDCFLLLLLSNLNKCLTHSVINFALYLHCKWMCLCACYVVSLQCMNRLVRSFNKYSLFISPVISLFTYFWTIASIERRRYNVSSCWTNSLITIRYRLAASKKFECNYVIAKYISMNENERVTGWMNENEEIVSLWV